MIDSLPKILRSLKPKYWNVGGTGRKYYGNDVFVYVREELPHRHHIRSPLPGDHIRFLTKQEAEHLMTIYSGNSEIVRSYY